MQAQAQKNFDVEDFVRHYNHLTPEYADHYREIFAYMRDRSPVTWTDAFGGFWVVTRYQDIMQVARDDDTFASRYGITITQDSRVLDPNFDPEKAMVGPLNPKTTGPLAIPDPGPNGEAPRINNFPIDLDPPHHRAYRRVLDPMFAPKAIAALQDWFQQLTDQLIDDVIEKGEANFSRDFGTPMTSIYTMKVAGLPLEDWADYAHIVQAGIAGSSSVQPRTKGVTPMDLRKRVAAEVAAQRAGARRKGSVIDVLLDAEVEGRKLDDWEIEGYVWLMIAGGVDTTQACMGSTFVWMARNPDRRRYLIDHPEELPDAIEECLRVFAPQQALARTVMKDTEVGGQKMKRGDRVLMCWSSGNLDETEFPNPEALDFKRENKRHMAFGVGAHRCMGSNIARMEFRILFSEILKRLPDYRVDEANLHRSPVAGIVFGYESVPFTFAPGKRKGGPRIL
ncbi:MAG: cytochrome P450 [Gammaproteobacteria bacterium]